MDIYDLFEYVCKKFPQPKSYWSEWHTMKRACEIFAVENALKICMEHPNGDIAEIIDILDDYAFGLELDANRKDVSPEAKTRLQYSAKAVYVLINYIKNGGII